MASRWANEFKFQFSTQNCDAIGSWFFAWLPRKVASIIDLGADPSEMVLEDSSYCDDWGVRNICVMVPLEDLVERFMGTFKEFPPRQGCGSFTQGYSVFQTEASVEMETRRVSEEFACFLAYASGSQQYPDSNTDLPCSFAPKQ